MQFPTRLTNLTDMVGKLEKRKEECTAWASSRSVMQATSP